MGYQGKWDAALSGGYNLRGCPGTCVGPRSTRIQIIRICRTVTSVLTCARDLRQRAHAVLNPATSPFCSQIFSATDARSSGEEAGAEPVRGPRAGGTLHARTVLQRRPCFQPGEEGWGVELGHWVPTGSCVEEQSNTFRPGNPLNLVLSGRGPRTPTHGQIPPGILLPFSSKSPPSLKKAWRLRDRCLLRPTGISRT